MQEELDLSAPNKAAMLSLPLEKKWIIWTSRRGQEDHSDLSNNPEDYTDRSVVRGEGPLRPLQQYRGLHKKDSSQVDYSDPSNNPEDYTDRSVVKGTTQTSPTIQRTTVHRQVSSQEDQSDHFNDSEDYTDRSVIRGTSLTTQVNQIIN